MKIIVSALAIVGALYLLGNIGDIFKGLREGIQEGLAEAKAKTQKTREDLPMKKYTALAAAVLLLFLGACGILDIHCDICGDDHRNLEQVNGAPTRNGFFEVFARDSNESLRIYVESCWSGSVAPEYRLSFVAWYSSEQLYEAISRANSNADFGVTLEGEAIILTSDIRGLEKISIKYHQNQRNTGYAYRIMRNNDEGLFYG